MNEKFNAYHQLQYDRIDKLETKRENFCNYVITISSAFCAIIFTNGEYLSIFNSISIFIFILLINGFAILFNFKTRLFIMMHQNRATMARLEFAQELEKINFTFPKPNSDKDFFRRDLIYSYLHVAIVIFFVIVLFFINIENKTKEQKSINVTEINC